MALWCGPWTIVSDRTNQAAQDAVDAVETAGGGVVYFPAGIYDITGLTVTSDNVILAGAGAATTLASADPTSPIVAFSNVDYWGIRDLRLDGGWNGSTGILVEGARWGTALNIIGDRFSAPLLDMRADGTADRNVNNNLIQHVHAINCTRFLRMQGSANRYVTLNTFTGLSAIGAQTAAATLIDLAQGVDTNTFAGITRLNLNSPQSIGVTFNSAQPDQPADVYGNHFDELAVDIDAPDSLPFVAGDMSTAGTGPWPSRVNLRVGGTHPAPPSLVSPHAYIHSPPQISPFTGAT